MIHAGRASSYADRRRAAADRLLLAENLSTRLDAAVHPDPATADGAPIDPDGVLRASVRALVPLARRNPAVEVMVSVGPEHTWAARLSHGPDGPVVDLVRGPGRPPAADRLIAGSESRIAAELATWLRTGCAR
jgi:hypothetical protein